MPAGQKHYNFAINTRLSSPRYDTWCKIQVIREKGAMVFFFLTIIMVAIVMRP